MICSRFARLMHALWYKKRDIRLSRFPPRLSENRRFGYPSEHSSVSHRVRCFYRYRKLFRMRNRMLGWDYLLRGILVSDLRLAELMSLSWDIPQTIRPVYRKGALPVLSFPAALQKNKRFQEIPLCPWLEQLLEEVPTELRTGWVFNPESLEPNYGRRPRVQRLSAERVGKIISRIGKKAGAIVDEGNARTGAPVTYASAHDLRRTFAVRLRNANLPPELIRKLMRHSDIKTTERSYLTEDTQHDAGRLRGLLTAENYQCGKLGTVLGTANS